MASARHPIGAHHGRVQLPVPPLARHAGPRDVQELRPDLVGWRRPLGRDEVGRAGQVSTRRGRPRLDRRADAPAVGVEGRPRQRRGRVRGEGARHGPRQDRGATRGHAGRPRLAELEHRRAGRHRGRVPWHALRPGRGHRLLRLLRRPVGLAGQDRIPPRHAVPPARARPEDGPRARGVARAARVRP